MNRQRNERKEESEGEEVEVFVDVVLNYQKSEQIFMRTPWNNYCFRAPHHLNYIHLSFQQLKGFFPTLFYLHLKNFPGLRSEERSRKQNSPSPVNSRFSVQLTPASPRRKWDWCEKQTHKTQCVSRIQICSENTFMVELFWSSF